MYYSYHHIKTILFILIMLQQYLVSGTSTTVCLQLWSYLDASKNLDRSVFSIFSIDSSGKIMFGIFRWEH